MDNLPAFRTLFEQDEFYDPSETRTIIQTLKPYFDIVRKGKTRYYNVPCAFDIETTSFLSNQLEKQAVMYEWTFGIYGAVIIGRTWEEFLDLLNVVIEELGLNQNKRLLCYCHNLSFEFQFMRKWLPIEKVFSLEERKPIYALTENGIEFRCSYLLSGYSLEKLGDNLRVYKCKKMVGDLDYRVMRNSKTKLSEKEYGYCVNDVKIVMAYIAEKIAEDGNIAKIPLTKTGYVRNYCRANCLQKCPVGEKLEYIEIIKSLTLTGEEYKQLKRAFQGGFTHANPFYVGKTLDDITSFDFTSSYPYVMVSEQFPMSKSEEVDITSYREFKRNLKCYCCLFDIEMRNVESRIFYDSYISISRCTKTENAVVNNGRIVSADYIETTFTEQDWFIVEKFYKVKWSDIKIHNFRRYFKGYLPTNFVKSILDLYKIKTEYKDVEGKEAEYMNSKEMLNSCYGMCVTDIVRPEIVYDNDDWQPMIEPDLSNQLEIYNKGKGRFLFYPWGVWVTAYARRNLFSGIIEFGADYVYSDTDSIKARNVEKHNEYIEKYNNDAKRKLEAAMKFHGLPMDMVEPQTKEGKKKLLGIWSFDGNYERFKTLGAKRYMVQYSHDDRNEVKKKGKISLTVSGLNKGKCVPYMIEKWGEKDVFDHFNNDLYIPPSKTGKLTHTYIDDSCDGLITDYQGNTIEYHEKSVIHLSEADYTLSMSKEFINYLLGVRDTTL